MSVADTAENTYLEDPARFANVVNNGLFGGYPVISPHLLEEADSSSRAYGGTAKIRDIVKKLYDKKMVIAIVGIEKQRVAISREHTVNGDLQGDEWLSGFGKEDKLIPVVTLAVYYGSKPWDGPLTLHGMLKVSPRIRSFLPLFCDYHVNLLEIRKIQEWDSYSDDLKTVFGFIKYMDDKQNLKKYIDENKELYEDISRENCLAIEAITKIDIIEKYRVKGKETVNMCRAWEELKNDAIMEGRALGKAESILDILEEYGEVSDKLRLQIMGQSDVNILSKWLKLAAGAGSIAAFQNAV